jgi:trehalose/maltose hydrolase-like predicted phosphorylase
MDEALTPTSAAAWSLRTEGYDPLRETSLESRFAISNGLMGVRGARAITRGVASGVGARTYLAGLFGTPNGQIVSPGLVPAPDWLQVSLSLRDRPLVRHPAEVAAHVRTLDFRRGVLLSQSILTSDGSTAPGLRLRVRTLRLVSQHTRALGLQLIQLEFLEVGTEAEVTFEASVDGTDLGLVIQRLSPGLGVWRTLGAGHGLALATNGQFLIDGEPVAATRIGESSHAWTWTARPGHAVSFARLAAVARSDVGSHDPGPEAQQALGVATQTGWRGVLSGHRDAWAERWRSSDVELEGDPEAQHALRFALYHLNSAADPTDDRVSIAARALTGDDYRGHVFWDTEVYLLPFFTMTWPAAARAMLMYRFHTLDGAREKATGMGWRGALYAWESADTGVEATPAEAVGPDREIIPILNGVQEQHISADVAHAVWRYWLASGDETFLREAGAEILFETARFWASRAIHEADGRRHIRGVIGPDEYHEHIDDNAFTNVMARWNLSRAIEAAVLVRVRWPDTWAALAARLNLTAAEIADWSDAAETIATGLDPATGLYDQFEGFRDLEEIDLGAYAGRSVPMDVVLGRDRIQRSQVVKQADVVALLGLLPETFTDASGSSNFQYYAPRCSHGSSLSRAMHGLVAARLGLVDMALEFFLQTAAIDLGDTHAAIDGGVHIAALGGLWLIAVYGFAGLTLTKSGLALDPRLPPTWRSLRFAVQWRGRSLSLKIGAEACAVEATLIAGDPMTLTLAGETHEIAVGKTITIGISAPVASANAPIVRDPQPAT